MAIHEAPQLLLDLALPLSGSSLIPTDSDSSNSNSEQQDVLLRPDFSVSTAEMESLAKRGATSSHIQGKKISFLNALISVILNFIKSFVVIKLSSVFATCSTWYNLFVIYLETIFCYLFFS